MKNLANLVMLVLISVVIFGCSGGDPSAADNDAFKNPPKDLKPPTAEQMAASSKGPAYIGPADGGDGKKAPANLPAGAPPPPTTGG